MKEIKDYVCTLEQAIRLKGLGVKQDSLYYWTKDLGIVLDKNGLSINYVILQRDQTLTFGINYGYDGDPDTLVYSAFTSQELGEMIIKVLHISYWGNDLHFDQNEAQERAGYLISLLEKKKKANN